MKNLAVVVMVVVGSLIFMGASSCTEGGYPSYSGYYSLQGTKTNSSVTTSSPPFKFVIPRGIAVFQNPLNRTNGHNQFRFTVFSVDEKGRGIIFNTSDGDLNPSGRITVRLMQYDWEDSRSRYIYQYGHACKYHVEARASISFNPGYSILEKVYPMTNEYVEVAGESYPVTKDWTKMDIKYEKWNSKKVSLTLGLVIEQKLDTLYPEYCNDYSYRNFNYSALSEYKLGTEFSPGDLRERDSRDILGAIAQAKKEIGSSSMLEDMLSLPESGYDLYQEINSIIEE